MRFSWKDIDRIKSYCDLPIIIKGIATKEDALLAIKHGVEIIYVSNHGGRQLDFGVGGLNVLPEIVEVVEISLSKSVAVSFKDDSSTSIKTLDSMGRVCLFSTTPRVRLRDLTISSFNI